MNGSGLQNGMEELNGMDKIDLNNSLSSATSSSSNVRSIWLPSNLISESVDFTLDIVIYLGCTMSLGTASVCLTVIVLNIHHRDATTEVPRWARFVLRLGARVFGLVDTSRLRNASCSSNTALREASVPDSVAVYPPGSDKLSAVCYAEGRDNHLMRETLLYHRINVDKLAKGICRDSRNREKSATAATQVRRTRDDVLSRLNQESVDQEIINEWHLLAKVFDRIFFIVVSFLMTSSATLILTSPWYMNG